MDRILIIGVDTPLGRRVALNLLKQGLNIRGTYLQAVTDLPQEVATVPLPDPSVEGDWLQLLDGITHVIHLDEFAAGDRKSTGFEVIMPDSGVTGRLALAATAKGVKRFLYLSSVQAMTDHTLPGKPLAWRTIYQPANAYGRMKLESERLIARQCAQAGVEWQIIRVPDVYGPDIDSPLLDLVQLVKNRRLIAIGFSVNQMAFIHIDNLAQLIALAVMHPRGGNEALLASDGKNVSTPELLRYIAHALDRWLVLLPLPHILLRFFSKDRKPARSAQLIPCHSLAIDDSHTREAIDWQPLLTPMAGIKDLVRSVVDS